MKGPRSVAAFPPSACQQQLLASLSLTAAPGSVALKLSYGGNAIPKPNMTVLHTSAPLNSKCKRETISRPPKTVAL